VAGLKEFPKIVKEFLSDPIDFFKKNWDLGIRLILAIWDDFLSLFGMKSGTILKVWDGIVSGLKTAFNAAVEFIKSVWDSTVNWIIEKAKTLWAWLDPFEPHSPSIVDKWAMGMSAMRAEYAGLQSFVMENPLIPHSAAAYQAGSGSFAGARGGNTSYVSYSQTFQLPPEARGGVDPERYALAVENSMMRRARSGI
jgi:hypothetical protein